MRVIIICAILVVLAMFSYWMNMRYKNRRFSYELTKSMGTVNYIRTVKVNYNGDIYYYLIGISERTSQAVFIMSCYQIDKEIKKCEKLLGKIISLMPYSICKCWETIELDELIKLNGHLPAHNFGSPVLTYNYYISR